ncbi:MAG: HtaA domain-containing protein [Actinomycetota bacterium]
MSDTTMAPPRRRSTTQRLRMPVMLLAVAFLASSCFSIWGLRASYTGYITSPIANGSITQYDVYNDTTGEFVWLTDWVDFDTGTNTGTIQLEGGIRTVGHMTTDGYLLDLALWNPRIEVTSPTAGTLYVDLNFRPYEGFSPPVFPALQAELDVAFATLDLSGVSWTPDGNGIISIVDAPAVGITAAMELIGWDDFYGANVTLDPFSFYFDPNDQAQALAAAPEVIVSRTDDLDPGDEILVFGEGFDPAGNIGTRPPFAGQPAGVYSVFGKFVDPWEPSTGAPSSSRTVIDSIWNLPLAQYNSLGGPVNPAVSLLDSFGTFETVITVDTDAAAGDYGVYVYPGSGAVNPAHEIEIPVTFP